MERVSAARGYCAEHAYSRGTVALTLRCVVFSFLLSDLLHAASSLLEILSLVFLSLSHTSTCTMCHPDHFMCHLVFSTQSCVDNQSTFLLSRPLICPLCLSPNFSSLFLTIQYFDTFLFSKQKFNGQSVHAQ